MNISNLQKTALKKTPEWKTFFAKNKQRLTKMDREILALHEETTKEIDCLECGNCCRTLGPMILPKDVDAMARALRLKPTDFIEKYLKTDEDKDMVFQKMPCPFLCEDNYCSIYENRPKACREYPHTDRKKFYQIYALSMKNAQTCPIVFRVLERLNEKPEWAKFS
jgi:Fe-S-cluster containining protein